MNIRKQTDEQLEKRYEMLKDQWDTLMSGENFLEHHASLCKLEYWMLEVAEELCERTLPSYLNRYI